MSPPELPIDRLLDAARRACPPLPEPSPWFEQKVLNSLGAETVPFFGFIDGSLIFRMLAGAAMLTGVSTAFLLLHPKNPYTETMNLADAAAQMESYQ